VFVGYAVSQQCMPTDNCAEASPNYTNVACVMLQEGHLCVQEAIQTAYSYCHCGYSPVLLLQELMDQLMQQPGLLQGQSLKS
jgi:hypothetical protein